MRNKDNGFIPIAYYSNIFDFLSVYLSIYKRIDILQIKQGV